jgi:hypothetical protein
MATSHGSNADFIGNGYVLSTYLNSASFSGQRDASESTTFKVRSKQYVPGLKDTTMTAEGIYDGDVDAADDILWAALVANTDGLFSYIPQGQETLQNRAFTVDTIESSYEINTDIGDVAQISAEFNAGANGRFNRGRVVRVMSAAGGPGTSAEADFGAASTTIGIGLVVHATASSTLVLKLQHSTTSGGSFVDIPGTLTFTTGRGSQRLWVPPQSINRYTRVSWTGTGTFMAIIERNA